MFSTKPKPSRREVHIDMWSEVHYRSLFATTPAARPYHGHRFETLFTIRQTRVSPGARPSEQLFSKVVLPTSQSDYCQYVVSLEFIPDAQIGYGHMSFGWQTLDRTYPSIDLRVSDVDSLSNTLIRLYVDNKSIGGAGLNCTWSADVTSILGKSSAEVWGDWLRDDWRTNPSDLSFLPGRRAFELKSLEFQCD